MDVADVVRLLNEVSNRLGEMSGSELRTLDSALQHAHTHVATELNRRSMFREQE